MRVHVSIQQGDKLTQKEISVLDGMAKGGTNKGVAYGLGISEQTVKNHISNIFVKLGVGDRTTAVLKAIGKGYITYNFADYVLIKKESIMDNKQKVGGITKC